MATSTQARGKGRVSRKARAEEDFKAIQALRMLDEEIPERDAIDTVIDALIDLHRVIDLTERRVQGLDPKLAGPMLLTSLNHIQRDLRAGGIRAT